MDLQATTTEHRSFAAPGGGTAEHYSVNGEIRKGAQKGIWIALNTRGTEGLLLSQAGREKKTAQSLTGTLSLQLAAVSSILLLH